MELTATGQLPTLLQMAHQEGNEEKVVSLVALNILALDAFLHLNNRLTEAEVDMVARDIVKVYGGALSFGDLNIILTNARRGVYGRFYERISGADVLGWVREYYDVRLGESAARVEGERERATEREREVRLTSKEKEAVALGQLAAELVGRRMTEGDKMAIEGQNSVSNETKGV